MIMEGMASVRNVSQRELDELWVKTPATKRFSSAELTDLGYVSIWNAADEEFWITTLPPIDARCQACERAMIVDAPPPWWVKAQKARSG